MRQPAKLTLGPVPYLWDAEKWRDFYFAIAEDSPVDTVSLGEVVCSKRSHFIEPVIETVIERLQRSGKTVHLASLALVTLERERRQVRRLVESDAVIEASDFSALWHVKGRPHTIGPLINTYNLATARLYAGHGAQCICLPPELPMTSILEIARAEVGAQIEVFAFGRTPLAISARCAHARSKGRSKDNCQFVCGEEPDGLVIDTLDDQHFLTLNGVQTMSYTCHVLTGELAELNAAGVSCFRLSPQDCDMAAVARIYRDVIDGALDPRSAIEALESTYPNVPFSNGFYHGVEGARWVQ